MKILDNFKIRRDYKNINELFNYLEENKEMISHIDLDKVYCIEVFIDIFYQKIINKEISIETSVRILGNFLHELDNDSKNYIFRSVLDKIYNNEDFVKAYCNDTIYKFPSRCNFPDKNFHKLIDTFIKILEIHTNKLANDILTFIIFNLDINGEFDKLTKRRLVNIINKKLEELKILSNTKINAIDDNISHNYCLFIKLSEFVYNDETINIIKKITINNLTFNIKLELLKVMIVKELEISKNNISSMFENIENGYNTLSLFERINAQKLIPKDVNITQEDIAMISMKEWITTFSGLDCEPSELKIINSILVDNYRYYVFKFRNPDIGNYPLLAVSKGYKEGSITTQGIGDDYSEFEELTDNYLEQVCKLIDTVKNLEN